MENKIKLFALLFFSYLTFNLFTQNMANTSDETENRNLLWKITRIGEVDSYLFGTSDILPVKGYELPKKVKKAFDKADRLVMELKLDNPNFQAEMMEHINMKDGKTFDKLLNEQDYKKLDAYLQQNLGVGIDFFNTFKPAVVRSYLIPTFMETEILSFEELFLELNQANKKEIEGLEQPVDQLSVYDEIRYEDQVAEIMQMVNKDGQTKASYQQLASLYKSENLEDIFHFIQKQLGASKTKLIFENRNRKFIPVIKTMTQSKSNFIAIGVGHLGGGNGLIELLKNEGYTVSAVID